MTNKERILLALNDVELCDDCLSFKSGVTPRQTVFTICNQLFEASIERHNGKCDHCHKAKKTSLISDCTPILVPIGEIPPVNVEPINRPWYWEGNVQSRVVSHLVRNNSTIRSVADTASRISGKDIIAVDSKGKELWVSVRAPTFKLAIGFRMLFLILSYTMEKTQTFGSVLLYQKALLPITIYSLALSGSKSLYPLQSIG